MFSRALRNNITIKKNIYKISKISTNNFSSFFDKKNIKYLPIVTQTKTNSDIISEDHGLKSFINKTYVYTGGCILTSMAGGLIMSNSPELLGYYPYLFCGGIVSGFGGIFGLSYFDYNVRTNKIRNLETNKEIEAYYSENSLPRQLSYYAIVGGMTMLVSPILVFANAQNILMPSMFITGAIFSGATLYANTRKVDELEAWSYGLHSGVFALVGCGFTGLASTLIFGENTFSIFLHSINVYAGIPIFAGLIAFNTHKAIKMYKNKDPDHLVCSVELYLDFMNILIRIIEIMQKFQKKD